MKRKRDKQTLIDLANKLNSNLPRSEQWFWNLYRKSGFDLKSDKQNAVIGPWIFDVANHELKYVIEIQDPTHLKKHRRVKDKAKRAWAIKHGFFYIQIKAWSIESFTQKMRTLSCWCG